MNLLPRIFPQANDDPDAVFERRLIRHEARIGGRLFGTLPKNRKRQFFCLDESTWIWHEEWTDKTGHHVVTTRYTVRETDVIKTQNGGPAQPLSIAETRHFTKAVRLYYQKVSADYRRLLQAA